MSTYRLKFINSLEKIGRVLELEAANDDDVTALSWVHSIRSDMTVEVCRMIAWSPARRQ